MRWVFGAWRRGAATPGRAGGCWRWRRLRKGANPLFARLDKRIEVISAVPSDFGYFVRDIAGFDPLRPGPYWHYAIFRLLNDRIKSRNERSLTSAE